MTATIRLDVSVLVGVILQALFFGIYQMLFLGCLYVLLSKKTGDIKWPFLITAIVMWILIGLNFGLSWSRIMDAFIGLQSSLAENPNAITDYFEDLAQWQEVSRSVVYLLLTAVADSLFVIYRMGCVAKASSRGGLKKQLPALGKNRAIIILPIAMLCASTTSAITTTFLISSATSRLFSPTLAKWARAFFTISLAQNILTTLLIIFRIWRVSKGIAGLKNNSFWPVVTILLESGTIYSSTLFVVLMTYASGSYAQYMVLDMLVPIIGITFNLIIVRVGLGISHIPTSRLAAATHPVFNRIPCQRLTLSVSQHVQTSREPDQMMIVGSMTDPRDDCTFQGLKKEGDGSEGAV